MFSNEMDQHCAWNHMETKFNKMDLADLCHKLLDVSTAHIQQGTALALGNPDEVKRGAEPALWHSLSYIFYHDYGWIIFCGNGSAELVQDTHPELATLIQICVDNEILYLKLDADSPTVEGLPTFDWEEPTQPAAVTSPIALAPAEPELAQQHKIEQAAQHGLEQFWATVAQRFPQVKTGDLPPEVCIQTERTMVSAVGIWVDINSPTVTQGGGIESPSTAADA